MDIIPMTEAYSFNESFKPIVFTLKPLKNIANGPTATEIKFTNPIMTAIWLFLALF